MVKSFLVGSGVGQLQLAFLQHGVRFLYVLVAIVVLEFIGVVGGYSIHVIMSLEAYFFRGVDEV